jgi:transposase-like protein
MTKRDVKRMAKQKTMTLLEFQKKFSTEKACQEHLFTIRWPNGFVCPKCGHTEYFNIKSRHLFQCKNCNHQASVTAGTIMEKTQLPLAKWFWAMFLMGEDKRGCSALYLSKQLGVAYSTAWAISHKIRTAMGTRDTMYLLEGVIELDDDFFGGTRKGSKRGRGTDKTAVLVGLSLDICGKPLFAKMSAVENVKGKTITEFAKDNIKSGSFISSDGYKSYNKLCGEGYSHEGKDFDPENDPDHLKWLHIVVSNAKAFILGTYHGLDSLHIQSYLDEFCFRFNRRFFGTQLFNRIVNACAFSCPISYSELIR